MADQRQHFQHGVEPSDVSSTSDVDVYITRQRTFARQPAIQKTHAGNLERVEEEPSLMADSSTDQKNRGIFCNNFSEQSYLAYDGPFKKPAQQAYCHRYPISVPYYENRYPCNNAMCREPHFCYEHQTNRDCYNPAMPMPPSPQHYFPHDCHRGGYVRQFRRSSPSFMNLNHANIKLPDQELPRPKPEWPQGYRPGNQGPSPSTPAQHLAALSSKDNTSIPPSTATSLRSISLDQFMPSNFSSPRQSARLTRKRAMSSSPLSIDSIDINSLIRTSPDSLIAYINAPRLSSAGSYGHLSANGVSPSPKPQRSPSMRSPFFGLWQSTPSVSRAKSDEGCEESKDVPMIKKELPENEMKKEVKDEKMIVDSNNNNIDEVKLSSVNSPSESDKRESDMENEETIEPEKDENNNECLCQWKDCNLLFQSQDELVKHVNTDHIKKERRDFTCYWIDCQREQKPFKAQYMLVVHMRRHTGEKPNKCTFPGCNKAYSRLENLKTHERSHTGERPYVCEYENCSKAFTNASDRAKHQNRTHSSVKPYVCTVPGCTKRYTDPSSLRKHKKTCHPEHFAGAKKPKIDKAKGKPDTGKDSQTKTSVSDSRGNVSQGPGSSHRAHGSGNPSSPRESEVRDQLKESSQGQQHGKAQQVDFSPQSFTGDLTSSSSCVDSPQSNNILCDTTDQGDESSHVKPSGHTPKDNNLPRSPQDVAGQPFSGRPVDIATPGGNVLVENPVIPNQLSLPTINKHSEVGKWIADVSQRMKNASKYSNEMKENLPIDFSSRRSSESGVSSYISSRRSSEVSTHHNRPPHSMVPPVTEEITTDEFPPNKEARDAYYLQQPPQFKHWNNNNKPRRNDFYDEMVRPSPVPDAFDSAQRRSSSGYGSHHNLTVIRSPVFHKVPIQNSPEPVSAANRRMSDSIICEADSSNRYFPLRNSNIVPRRSSEPATKFYSYDSSEFNTSSLASRQPGNQTPMERQENHLSLPDIYQSHPRDCGLINTQLASLRPQPLESGQKLTHYPYSVEASNKTNFYPHPPNCTQRIRGPPEATNHPRKGLWEYEQHINQQLAPVSDRQHDGHMSNTDRSYEVMVNDMGNLNTSEIVNEAVFPGAPSNMVVNDMNTLLSSLIEEERYFEKRQGNENTSSAALSHLF